MQENSATTLAPASKSGRPSKSTADTSDVAKAGVLAAGALAVATGTKHAFSCSRGLHAEKLVLRLLNVPFLVRAVAAVVGSAGTTFVTGGLLALDSITPLAALQQVVGLAVTGYYGGKLLSHETRKSILRSNQSTLTAEQEAASPGKTSTASAPASSMVIDSELVSVQDVGLGELEQDITAVLERCSFRDEQGRLVVKDEEELVKQLSQLVRSKVSQLQETIEGMRQQMTALNAQLEAKDEEASLLAKTLRVCM